MQASNKKDSILYQQKVITSKNISHRKCWNYKYQIFKLRYIVGYAL